MTQTTLLRKRYWFNNHTKPGTVAISTKKFEMSVMYSGMRFVPTAHDFAKREIELVQIHGYHTFDIEAVPSVHEAFEEHHMGKIHAIAPLALTEVDGEFKWEPGLPKMLS